MLLACCTHGQGDSICKFVNEEGELDVNVAFVGKSERGSTKVKVHSNILCNTGPYQPRFAEVGEPPWGE